MFLIKIIRKLYKGLSGADSPTQIALGFGLGLILGAVPLRSGVGIFLLAVVLLFRVSLAFAVVGWVIAGALTAAFLRDTFAAFGFWILETPALQGLWTFVLNLPGVALLGLDRYAAMGGFVAALVAAAVLFWPARFLVIRYRRQVVERLSQSKTFKYLTSLWIVRIVRWIFVGAL